MLIQGIVGREQEISTLKSLLVSDEAEFVSIIGRRRVGKTFLVHAVYKDHFAFDMIGTQNGTLEAQLQNFADQFNFYAQPEYPINPPTKWAEAFRILRMYLQKQDLTEKKVLFFDELPWLSSQKSGFLEAFGYFWNSWASKQNLVLVICGSAASWMIQKVIHDKGGLYNRVTKRLNLSPFTLYETELYLQKRGLNLNRYQITELYLAIGGIPHYLKELKKGESVAQNIDRLCFDPNGILYDEFEQLYPSLFDHAENHIAVVRALATKPSGMTRKEIIDHTKRTNGGGLTQTIEELIHSGFVTEYPPFERLKRETLYRLTDEYSLFYVKFIEKMKKEGVGIWRNFEQTPTFRTWSGYAFEGICLKHLPEIKKALGILGIFSTAASFYQKGKEGMDGCQIDLLIDRNDNVINLCEIKWSISEYIITKSYAADLRKKIALFKHYSTTKKQVFFTFMSTYGLVQNEHSGGLVDNELTLNDLFVANF
jgi:uncharacterized protein